MSTVDPAVQWLFWLMLAPLSFVASWVPQWRGNWRHWYDKQAEYPFMHTPLWFSGWWTTLLFSVSFTGMFMLWRDSQLDMSSLNSNLYTSSIVIYLVGIILYGTWQIPYYYYALPWQSLGIIGIGSVLFSASTALTCSLHGRGVSVYPMACVFQCVWTGWLWLVVIANSLLGFYRCSQYYDYRLQHQPRLHLRLWSVTAEVIAADGANPAEDLASPLTINL